MGLTGTTNQAQQYMQAVLSSQPERPPRLSRRDRSYYCFHLDLSAERQFLLANLVRYMSSYGAKYSAFLDINVTHIITDKPFTAVQSSPMVQKFGCKLLSLSDFLKKIVESYARSHAFTRPPMSPTLLKAAEEMDHGRDLFNMLADERRKNVGAVTARASRAITPLYNSANVSNVLQKVRGAPNSRPGVAVNPGDEAINFEYKVLGSIHDRKVVYIAFKYPFMMIEEATQTFTPVCKEYNVNEHGQNTFPYLNLKSEPFHCPWATRSNPTQHIYMISPIVTAPVLVPIGDRNRALKTIRTLSDHRLNLYESIHRRPRFVPKGFGAAPIPPIGPTTFVTKAQERVRPGFCECCNEKYSQMEKHLQLESHRRLVTTLEFYRTVDRVISTLSRPILYSPKLATENVAAKLASPISPVKSNGGGTVGSGGGGNGHYHHQQQQQSIQARIKSMPLKNISNISNIPLVVSAIKPVAALEIEVGSDSPIYSSPSLKRRRSQRLVGRSSRVTSKFVL